MPAESPTVLSDQATESMAAYFCRMADTVGLPRSAAMIYHTLFLAEGPLSFTEVVEQSGLSKASASTGLKLLERMRAAEVVVVPNARGTHYVAELSIRRLVTGFLEQNLLPGFEAGGRILDDAPDGADESKLPAHLAARLNSLRTWHGLATTFLPALTALDAVDD